MLTMQVLAKQCSLAQHFGGFLRYAATHRYTDSTEELAGKCSTCLCHFLSVCPSKCVYISLFGMLTFVKRLRSVVSVVN